MTEDPVLDWLLEEDQPSVRYGVLTELQGKRPDDAEVRSTAAQIPKRGWAADILRKQKPGGYWEPSEPKSTERWLSFLYRPKYVATNWRALVLADLGMTSKDPRIAKTSEKFFEYRLQLGSMVNFFNDEVCIVGNTARMLTRFGYGEDRRVKKLFDRLVEDQKDDGGWNCFPSEHGTLDGWEGLAAYAALPRPQRSAAIDRSVERGAEFYLDRALFNEGKKRYEPWFRFHYPNHYYYDLLVGLDTITRLGYAGDRRLAPALKILGEKRNPDGTWSLDKIHPDLGPGAGYSMSKKPTPFALETARRPSKWITLVARRVLHRVDEAS